MDYAYSILTRCFWFNLIIFAVILMLLIFAIRGAHSTKQGVRAIIIGIVLVAFLAVILVPCGMDFIGHNIIEENAVYRNYDKSKSNSGLLGMHSVMLETEGGRVLKLATAPSSLADFPIGSFRVVAYYTENSKLLLHMEIVETALDTSS